MWSARSNADPLPDEKIARFQRMLLERYGEKVSFAEAKIRYLKILNLFWMLSHKPPEPGEPPYDPPPSPWL